MTADIYKPPVKALRKFIVCLIIIVSSILLQSCSKWGWYGIIFGASAVAYIFIGGDYITIYEFKVNNRTEDTVKVIYKTVDMLNDSTTILSSDSTTILDKVEIIRRGGELNKKEFNGIFDRLGILTKDEDFYIPHPNDKSKWVFSKNGIRSYTLTIRDSLFISTDSIIKN